AISTRRSLKITTRCHSVRSRRSPEVRSRQLSEVARFRLAMRVPSLVERISGSRPRLPTRITLLTLPAMGSLSYPLTLGNLRVVRLGRILSSRADVPTLFLSPLSTGPAGRFDYPGVRAAHRMEGFTTEGSETVRRIFPADRAAFGRANQSHGLTASVVNTLFLTSCGL